MKAIFGLSMMLVSLSGYAAEGMYSGTPLFSYEKDVSALTEAQRLDERAACASRLEAEKMKIIGAGGTVLSEYACSIQTIKQVGGKDVFYIAGNFRFIK